MVNIQINEEDLLDLLMQRVEYWTTDTHILSLYKQYLEDLIDWRCFEGTNLDIYQLIDNLYLNNTQIMNEEDLKNEDIDVNDPEKVLARDVDNDLYLVSTY